MPNYKKNISIVWNKWKAFLNWMDRKLDGRTAFVKKAACLLGEGSTVYIDIQLRHGGGVTHAKLNSVALRTISFLPNYAGAANCTWSLSNIKRITIVDVIEKI